MIRDIRDPKPLGEKLIEQAPIARGAYGPDIQLSDLWDFHVSLFDHPDYQGSTLGQETAQAYLDELQSRTDRYAASTLAALKEGRKPDDPG